MAPVSNRSQSPLTRASSRHFVVTPAATRSWTCRWTAPSRCPSCSTQIQEHPLSRKTLHIDFLAVNMQEERTIDVPLIVVGESEAIERLGGVLLHLRDAVSVRAKPDDIPSGIELDISALVDFETTLHASDLKMPEGVALVTDEGEALARVQAPRVEEEPVVAEEAAEGAEAAETEAATGEAESGGGDATEASEES